MTGDVIPDFPPDSVAFGIQVTCTASSATGSLWIEYTVEFASPKLPDLITGLGITKYADGKATEPGSVLYNNGAQRCPVTEGEFWIGASANTNTPLSIGQSDLKPGYTLLKKIFGPEIEPPPNNVLASIWDKGTFVKLVRSAGASEFWANGTNQMWPDFRSDINGNVVFYAAPTFAALLRGITRPKSA